MADEVDYDNDPINEELEIINEEEDAARRGSIEDLRGALEEIGVGRQTPIISQVDGETVIPAGGETGIIMTTNEEKVMTPLTVNLDDPIRNVISRAVGVGNDYHFELKNGVILNPNTTLREAGVEFGDVIRLLPGASDSGYITKEASPALSVNNETTLKEVVEDRAETEMDIDMLLDKEMREKGEITVTETDGNFRVVHCEKNDTVGEIISRATGTTDNDEFDLVAGNGSISRTLTLRDAGIPFNSQLRLNEREINVFVRTLDGRNHTIQIRRSETVQALKTRMRDINQVPIHQQMLQFQSTTLIDKEKLKTYKIRNNSQIESTCRLRGGAH